MGSFQVHRKACACILHKVASTGGSSIDPSLKNDRLIVVHLVCRSLRLESHSENHTLWQNSVGYADVRSGILGMYVARYGKHSPGFSDCPMVFRRWLLTNDDVGGPILGRRNADGEKVWLIS